LFADGTVIVHMPQHMRLPGGNSSDDNDDEQLDHSTIEHAQGTHEQTFFNPLQSVIALNGTVHSSFGAYTASLQGNKSHEISDERFQRFVCILKGDTPETDLAQLKRDREKLFNIPRSSGPKQGTAHDSLLASGSCILALVHALAKASIGPNVGIPTRAASRPWCQRQSVKQ